MMNNETQLVFFPIEKLQSLLTPVINKLETIESKLLKKEKAPKGYYRNKELKELFGLSPNTIITYRQTGKIPFTMIGEIYLYPISKINEELKKNSNY